MGGEIQCRGLALEGGWPASGPVWHLWPQTAIDCSPSHSWPPHEEPWTSGRPGFPLPSILEALRECRAIHYTTSNNHRRKSGLCAPSTLGGLGLDLEKKKLLIPGPVA